MLKKRLVQSAASLVLLAAFSAGAYAQCDNVGEQMELRNSLIERIETLENSTPFVEQFEEVKRAVDVLHETLKNTRGDLDQVREDLDEVLGLVREQNQELQNVRRWARSAYSNPDWEPSSGGGDSSLTLSEGLETTSGWIEEVEGLTGDFQGALNVLEGAVAARDGSPSEQLEAFENYFTTLTDKLDDYSDIAPMIKVFTQMFDFYGKAIGAIRVSVQSIESEYARRDAILEQLGDEYKNVRYTWPQTTPWERLNRQIRDLEQELAEVERQLEECGVNLDEPEEEPASDMMRTELYRARDAAERRCIRDTPFRNKSEMIAARNRYLAAAQRYYRATRPFFPERYGAELSVVEEIDYIRVRNERFKNRIVAAEEAVQRAEAESAEIERRFQAYRNGELQLSSHDAGQLNIDRVEKEREVAALREQADYVREQAAERDEAVRNLLETQSQLDNFEICVRNWVEDLSDHLGWDKFWTHHYLGDLYRPRLASGRGDCSVGPGISEGFCNTPGGWRISGDAQSGSVIPSHRGAGAGFIEATDDEAGGVWYWEAPDRFKGDLCSFVGGSLRFTVSQSKTDNGFDAPDVVIEGPAGTLSYALGAAPGTDWTSFEAPLAPAAGWSGAPDAAAFEAVLGEVTRLKIRGEFRTGDDIGKMDMVSLIPGADVEGAARCRDARSLITVEARGDEYQGWPLMRVYADDRLIGEVTVASNEWREYRFRFAGAAPGVVRVEYPNDQYGGSTDRDRNLHVRQLTVGRRAFSPEAAQYDRYTEEDTSGQSAMIWSGQLIFEVK